jgi:CDP-glucose 4,6-dehydratase
MNPQFWRDKKVLLTGHTGFKGSWLSICLQSLGSELTGFSLPPPSDPSLYVLAGVARGMRSIEGDIRDLPHMRAVMQESQPEIVFHLAAQSLVRQSYADPIGTFATNVLGTAHVLEAVRDVSSVRVVIIVTTDKCYENKEDGHAYRETDPLGGFDPYSSSKACAELVTAAFRNSFLESPQNKRPIGVASVRAGNVIGGGDWATDRLIPDVMRGVLQGREVVIRNPYAVRPWQHVLEPLHGYLLLAEKLYHDPRSYSEAWNFGPNESDSQAVETLLQELARSWGPGIRWRIDNGHHHHEAKYLRLDSSKARTVLGWRPQWNLSQAVEATAEWYKALQSQKDAALLTREQIRAYQSALHVATATLTQ